MKTPIVLVHPRITREEFEDTKGVTRICKSKKAENTMTKRKGTKDKILGTLHQRPPP
jgi:hypothetical protein